MFTVVIIWHVKLWKLYITHLEYLQLFDIDFLSVVWVGLKLTIFSSEPCVFWGCRCNYHDWPYMWLLIINCVVMLIEDIWCIHILIFKLSSRFPQLTFWVSFAWGGYNILYLFCLSYALLFLSGKPHNNKPHVSMQLFEGNEQFGKLTGFPTSGARDLEV